jgi:hypothetical protein
VQDGHGGREGDALVAAFARWAAEQRAVVAAGARTRERSLREQAAASATWLGVVVDLAERAAPVTAVVAGQRRPGRLVGVGRDFCVLQADTGRTALVALSAISELWPDGPAARDTPAGDRGAAINLPLMTALAMLAEDRSPVALISSTGVETSGELVAAGEDVLTLRTAPPGRRLVYVPARAVAVCELR